MQRIHVRGAVPSIRSAAPIVRGAALASVAAVLVAACSTGGGGAGTSTQGGSTPSAAGGGTATAGGGTSSPPSAAMKTGPGVDAQSKTITLGALAPLSGPAELVGQPAMAGMQAYFDYVNAHNGLAGWTVKLDVKDDQYNPQLHVQEYNQIVGGVAMIGFSIGSQTTAATEQAAQQAGVVIGTGAESSAFVGQPVNVMVGSPYAIDVANGLYYLTHTIGKAGAKVGIIYQNDDYGADGLKGYLAAKSAYGFDDVGHATYAPTDTQFSSQALAMKNAGAQYVVLTAIPTAAASIIGTAAAIGYHPQWILQGPAWSEYLISSTGAKGGKPTPVAQAIQGAWVLGFQDAWGDTSAPGDAQFQAILKQYDPKQVPDNYYKYGYSMAVMETALLRKAIADNDLSRAGIMNAKENLGTVSFGGLVPDATYTPANGPADRQTNVSVVDLAAVGYLKQIASLLEGPAAKSMTFAAG